jgi:hypothetical protein
MKILHVIPSIAAVRGGPSVAVIEIVKSLQLIDEVEVSLDFVEVADLDHFLAQAG